MPGPAVVLVHGAFADASGFAGVIRELESTGHTALAPLPHPETSALAHALPPVAAALSGSPPPRRPPPPPAPGHATTAPR